MNFFYLLLTSLMLGFSTKTEIPHAEFERAFNENDAAKIISFSKDKVLLKILDQEGAYSQTQAKLILKDFFTKYPKGKFNFVFKGKSEESGSFSIGNYEVKDKSFRVTLHFKKLGSVFLAETIQIE